MFHASGREHVCRNCKKPKQANRSISRELTHREKQVVRLVRYGKANKEIAVELHLSVGTVKEYLHNIFRKLKISNRTELAVWGVHWLPDVNLPFHTKPPAPPLPHGFVVLNRSLPERPELREN